MPGVSIPFSAKSLIRSRFLWKIYIAYAGLFTVASLAMIWLVNSKVRESLVEEVVLSLQEKIVLLAPYGREAFERTTDKSGELELQKKLRDFSEGTHARITLIRVDGTVIAETHGDLAGLENYFDRPEVQGALKANFASNQLQSQRFGEETLFVAQAIRNQGMPIGIVRVGVPISRLNERLDSVTQLALAAGVFGILIALLSGFLLARRVTLPIQEIMIAADALQRGDYSARVKTMPSDELGTLGVTLNRLGEELTRRISTISQERAQLKAMLAGLVEGIIAVDDNNQVMFSNRAANSLLRSPVGESAGKPLDSISGMRDLMPLVTRARLQRELVQDEMIVGDGESAFSLETKATPFKGDRTSGVIVMVHDVTGLRRLERVRQDFVANVSHELKTPLTSIKGYVETLLSGALDDREVAVRFLDKIDRNVIRLVNLVQDILSLARIEADEELIKPVPVEILGLTRTVLVRHEDDFKQKNISIVTELGAEAITVIGEREALVQVLDNLVTNAIKYTPAGGRVTVKLKKVGLSGRIEVSDTGIGIPKDHLDRIFERFYRVDKARSREMGGTGLGLSIVKHLVSSMNGRIGVDSVVGAGSRFWVELELAQ